MKRAVRILAVLAIFTAFGLALSPLRPASAQSAPSADQYTWTSVDDQGNLQVHLYFFWSLTCPHCQEAHPYIMALPDKLPWLVLHEAELTARQENAYEYVNMAASLGQEAMYVPAFFFCKTMVTGYDTAETSGADLRQQLIDCYEATQAEVAAGGKLPGATQPGAPAPAESEPAVPAKGEPGAAAVAPEAMLAIPFIGEVNMSGLSLPAMTVVIAGLDAFNPCAFFVLMFLLSLMVHAQSRKRMLLIGGTFVLVSGLIYFVFMSAWLNVFLWVGELKIITLAAGIVAVVVALINIKDFFWFKQGMSLTIPESAKPGLYARMRNLVHAGSLGAMMFSTVLLAIAANSYELLCTAGFPMVYTRILTMHDLPTATYYAYLAVYNLIYIIPLLAIVILFAVKFGSRKLSEDEGRVLKLVSGLMMLMLGLVLIFNPNALSQVGVAVGLLLGTLALAGILVWVDRQRRPAEPPAPAKRKARAH